MGLSIQTNVTSLIAQQNLNVNSAFQSNTIQQLTSGYRINSSGDDAAGLAVANGYRSNVSQLTQGVRNANDGVSVFQTIDGGLSNISQILDRLNTLATESASGTFSGNRSTIDNEYQSLVTEITRQATNVGLNSGGTYNTNLGIYIGGGGGTSTTNAQTNSQVSVDLSGTSNAVDAASLGLTGTSVAGGGVTIAGNTVNLNNTATPFLAGGSQSFVFNVDGSTSTGSNQLGTEATITATINGGTNGLTGAGVVSALNTALGASGITASINSSGLLQFSGSTAFTLNQVSAYGGTGNAAVSTANTGIAANTGYYNYQNTATAGSAGTEAFTIQTGGTAVNISLTSTTEATAATAVQNINQQLAAAGVTGVTAIATANTGGTTAGSGISFQSQNAFSLNVTTSGGLLFGATGAQTITAPTTGSTSTGNATSALLAIQTATQNLGLVQGKVGAGENLLNDAVNLAQSQITDFSAAESRIRDANIATEAANLTKSQVLQQSSIAALAQANSAPQQLLTLLKG